jgi:hypothetical protein
MPALTVALVILAVAVSGGSVVQASKDALPGDAFYYPKMAVEGFEVTLALSDKAKVEVYLNQAERRLAEIRKANGSDKTAAAVAAAEAYVQDLSQADLYIAHMEASGQDVSNIAARVAAALNWQRLSLAAEARVAGPAYSAIERALRAAETELWRSNSRLLRNVSTGKPLTGLRTTALEHRAAFAPPLLPS